jgi:hypothetical protein
LLEKGIYIVKDGSSIAGHLGDLCKQQVYIAWPAGKEKPISVLAAGNARAHQQLNNNTEHLQLIGEEQVQMEDAHRRQAAATPSKPAKPSHLLGRTIQTPHAERTMTPDRPRPTQFRDVPQTTNTQSRPTQFQDVPQTTNTQSRPTQFRDIPQTTNTQSRPTQFQDIPQTTNAQRETAATTTTSQYFELENYQEDLYAKKIAVLLKMYRTEYKYNSHSDIFDYKFKIFLSFCQKSGVPKAGLQSAFSIMLKDEALDFYFVN